jgi:superfamily II DNA or RNA helicase
MPFSPSCPCAKPLDGLCHHRSMRLPKLHEWPKAEADVLVRRSLLTAETEEGIKKLLRFDNPEFFSARSSGQDTEGIARYIKAYQKYPNAYRLPRHAPFQKLSIRTPRFVYPETQKLPWTFHGTLRDQQVPAFAAIEHQLIYRKDGILVLSCGKGKTVLATAAFGWQQRPALAVVTQLFIGEQWKNALLEFTDIPEDRIGYIGDGHAEWDKDFVIATIQTLATKDFPWQFYRRFGLVFFDECHRLGAQHFGRVAPTFTGQRIGLTATLNRTDKMEQLFMLHLGRVFYEDKQQDLVPRVYFERTTTDKNVKGFRWQSPKLNVSKVITHLSKLDYRQEFILDLLKDAYSKKRKILFLSERKQELHDLCKQLRKLKYDASVCVGGMKQEERTKALNSRIIGATSQLVTEGLDRKDIDTLLILYPQSSENFTEQSAGRILRLDDNKRPPVIVVLVDAGVYDDDRDNQPFTAKARRMEATFRRLGYDIRRGVDEAAAA